MGEGVRDRVRVAPWVINLSAVALITLMGFTIRASARVGSVETQVQNNTEDINGLDIEKASKEKVDMTYDAVIRLETKFDEYVNAKE